MDDAAKPIERTTVALENLAVGVPTSAGSPAGPTPPAPRIADRDAPPADGGGARAPRAARARDPRSLTSRPTRRIARVAGHRDVRESPSDFPHVVTRVRSVSFGRRRLNVLTAS